MSDDGRLYGEIPLGYYRVRRTIEQFDAHPPIAAAKAARELKAEKSNLAEREWAVAALEDHGFRATAAHDRLAQFLGELALRGRPRILVGFVLALRNRPRAVVLARPERAAHMSE